VSRPPVPAMIIAAPGSNSGKTTVTLALLRAFAKSGINVSSFKTGPDYIDPAFHHRASGRACFNLDPWAMRPQTLRHIWENVTTDSDLVIGEGVMGLFDGAADGSGSTADLAEFLDIPIILVVNAKGQAASVGALLHGFNSYRKSSRLAGVIFNAVGSANHVAMLKATAEQVGVPYLGAIPKSDQLTLPRRHLGLVQAQENTELDNFLDQAADIIAAHVDLAKLQSLATTSRIKPGTEISATAPGQHIAIAKDAAFAFCYPHQIATWQKAGAQISYFSPLLDQAPDGAADFIYLPGGYPELHADSLARAHNFKTALCAAAHKKVGIFGECGGYMVLGQTLTDKTGIAHPMSGLLPIHTSFEHPKLHLGYRQAKLAGPCALGFAGTRFSAHEFHYASVIGTEGSAPLFSLKNATNDDLGASGAISGSVCGSFVHLIDKAYDDD